MSNETPEETKIAIAEAYENMRKNDKIKTYCDDNDISEATFHKYKGYNKPIKKEENTEEDKDFEEDFKPDDEDENEDEDETIEEIDIVID